MGLLSPGWHNFAMNIVVAFGIALRAFCISKASLAAENLALRQQLAVLHRQSPKPRLRWWDRVFWIWLRSLWSGWREALVIVQPDTVVRWSREAFRLWWRWKSRGKPGRPRIDADLRKLIAQMSRENPLWGAPRIQAELHMLGYDLAASTVARYMRRERKPPSQAWRTFLKNHVGSLVAIDFFVVPTVTFHLLYGFVVLAHDRRRIVHFNVTSSPSAAWVAQQLREAFPFDQSPSYLIRDNDGIYGDQVRRQLELMDIEEVLTAPGSPWQNAYVERLIGTIRRDLLDHVIVLNEDHLRNLLHRYVTYYNESRCHMSLDGDAPNHREIEPLIAGKIVAEPMVGGLHRRYRRAA